MSLSPEGERVLDLAQRLTGLHREARELLVTVLEAADAGVYDPVSDVHAVRLPGLIVRAMRHLIDDDDLP